MEQIAEMFYKIFEKSEYNKDIAIEDYDNVVKPFFKSLTKEQFSIFLKLEGEYLDYAYLCAKKAIEFLLSLLFNEE
ncbi:MAG: hypothetical protein ACI4R8_04705 [Candidatus Caccovivens sp.]